MAKVVGMIPARYESTRLPGKVLRLLAGKPMIQWVFERAKSAAVLDDLVVATDDGRVASAVESFGGRSIMTSSSCQSGTDRLAEAVQKEGSGVEDAEIIVNIQADQPFIDPGMIEEGVRPLLEDLELPMATLMHPICRIEDLTDPGVVKTVVDRFGNALYFSRSLIPFPQKEIPHQVYEHVGLYVYRKDFLLRLAGWEPTLLERIESLEQLRVLEHGYTMRVVTTRCTDNEFHGFSVDTKKDLERAEAMIRERWEIQGEDGV